MKPVKILVPLILISAFLVFLVGYSGLISGRKLTIQSGEVQVHGTSDRFTLKGSFYIGPPNQSVDGTDLEPPRRSITSHGSGGACLLADLNFIGIPDIPLVADPGGTHRPPCASDDFCSAALTRTLNQTGWASYCIEGRCWTRPGKQKDYCLVSAPYNDYKFWPTGVHTFEAPTDSPSVVTVADLYRELRIEGKQVNWRVHSCLNESAGLAVDNGACGGGIGTPKLVDYGPIKSVP